MDWHEIENYVASEVRFKRFKSKEVGSKSFAWKQSYSFAQMVLFRQERSCTASNLTLPKSRERRRGGEYPQLWARRVQEEVGVADVSEAGRDASEAWEDFWSMSGEFICLWPPRSGVYRQSHHSHEKQKPNLDNLEESIIDDLWNIEKFELSQEIGADPGGSESSTKRPPQCYSWVDVRLTKNSSHIEARNDLVPRVVIYLQMFSIESNAAME